MATWVREGGGDREGQETEVIVRHKETAVIGMLRIWIIMMVL